MIHTPYPTLKTSSNAWAQDLASGDVSILVDNLPSMDPLQLFHTGMACAERGLMSAMNVVLAAVKSLDRPDALTLMGGHWLEGAILFQQLKMARHLRNSEVQPYVGHCPPNSQIPGTGFLQRRNSRMIERLEEIDTWDEEFVDQWRRSSLPALAMFRAIHHSSLECVAKLIAHGAPVNEPVEGYLPVWACLRAGKKPVMELLLKHGARVDQAGEIAGKTLLVFACERGHRGIVDLLIDAGAPVMECSSLGVSPAQSARAAGHYEMAAQLEAICLGIHSPVPTGISNSRRF